jgi:hypothetical protein
MVRSSQRDCKGFVRKARPRRRTDPQQIDSRDPGPERKLQVLVLGVPHPSFCPSQEETGELQDPSFPHQRLAVSVPFTGLMIRPGLQAWYRRRPTPTPSPALASSARQGGTINSPRRGVPKGPQGDSFFWGEQASRLARQISVFLSFPARSSFRRWQKKRQRKLSPAAPCSPPSALQPPTEPGAEAPGPSAGRGRRRTVLVQPVQPSPGQSPLL